MLDGRKLDAIGRRVADRLQEDGVLEGNLESMLPMYQEPEIAQERLDEIGDRLAGLMEEPRPARGRPEGNLRGVLWAAAAVAAGILIVIAMTPTEQSPPPRPLLIPIAEKTDHVRPTPPPAPPPKVRPEPTPAPPPPKTVVTAPDPFDAAPGRPPKRETPPPPPDPVVPPSTPERTSPAPTVVARAVLAKVERVEGVVEWINGADRNAVAVAESVVAQAGIETGANGRIVLQYPDRTTL